MTDLEKIMDMYPQLKFYFIEVDDPHYHGDIDGNKVFINSKQNDYDWLITALHEITHFEYDKGDCTNKKYITNLRSEKWAMLESKAEYKRIFG